MKTTEVGQPQQQPATAQTQGVEEAKPEAPSSDVGVKLRGTPSARQPATAQTPSIDEPKPAVPSSEAGEPKQPVASAIFSFFGIALGGWLGYLIAGFIGACLLIWVVRWIRGSRRPA